MIRMLKKTNQLLSVSDDIFFVHQTDKLTHTRLTCVSSTKGPYFMYMLLVVELANKPAPSPTAPLAPAKVELYFH